MLTLHARDTHMEHTLPEDRVSTRVSRRTLIQNSTEGDSGYTQCLQNICTRIRLRRYTLIMHTHLTKSTFQGQGMSSLLT